MDRINHVKIVTPDPEAVDRFLREVLEIPAGWPIAPDDGSAAPTAVLSPARDANGNFTAESVHEFRGAPSTAGGFIVGSTDSRQFQVLKGDHAHIWAVAVGSRHIERAYERCVARGIPCTEPSKTPWGDRAIRFFFAEVGGILFEVMRLEAAPASSSGASERVGA